MTIQEAWKRILEIRGTRTTKVTMEFWQYGSDIGGEREIKLSLWDGNKHYDTKSLEDLIRAAEASVAKTTEAIDGELPKMGGENEPAS